MLAVNCQDSDKEPVIASCISVREDYIDVVWYDGNYSSSWKPWKIRDPSNRRKIIDWTDTIPLSSIILFAFELTKTGHLRKKTILVNLKKTTLNYVNSYIALCNLKSIIP